MNYEELLSESDNVGLIVKEKPLKYNDGRIKGKRVAIRRDIKTSTEKACVLAEELGHYHTTVGNILNQTSVSNRKQERRAHIWAHDRLIDLTGIISAYKAGCCNAHEVAEHLEVTEEFLQEAISYYRQRYGICARVGNYIIYFEPGIAVLERKQIEA